MASDDNLIVPIFKTIAQSNENKSRKEGRPIFDNLEVVEIRFAGDRQKVSVFPAHAVSANVDQADGTTREVTYAERFSQQYQQFRKEGGSQTVSGTPLDELPFLTQAQRSELRGFNIYTAEMLSSLDGASLKALGMGGREMKNQAEAYLQAAADTSVETRLAAENEALRAQLAALQAPAPKAKGKAKDEPETDERPASEFDDWSDEDLKSWIKAEGGAVRGNPSHETLVRMADEITASKAA